MSELGIYLHVISTIGIRRKLRKKKGCIVAGRSWVNFQNCSFEGNNVVGKFSNLDHCMFGFGTYVARHSTLINTEVGRFCAIGPNVHIINGRHPSKGFVSIHPAFYSTAKQAGFTYAEESLFSEHMWADPEAGMMVKIGNDVWIGDGVSIMEGVTIADGTIVGAGAVVVKDTEPYSVVGGAGQGNPI